MARRRGVPSLAGSGQHSADRPVDDPTGRIAFGPNPYKGLEYFDKADADRFFGREALTEKLYALIDLLDADLRLLPVLGPSGSASPRWCVPGSSHACPTIPNRLSMSRASVLTPGSHPLEVLARTLLGSRRGTRPRIQNG